MSISSSFRTLAFKSPYRIHTFTPNSPLRKTLISPPKLLSSSSFFKSISFERLLPKTTPTKPPNSLPSPSSPSLQPIDGLPPKLQEIITLFQGVQQPKAKYEQLLFYGRNLPPLDERYKTRANKVQGCVSQVWVRAYLDSDENVWFEADSDSVLTKGLAALLVLGLSGRPVPEIVLVKPDFITRLGLQQSLSPSRNNGFLNMLKLMQKKAKLLTLEDLKGEEGQSEPGIDQSELEIEGYPIEGEIGGSILGSGNVNGGVELETEGNATEGEIGGSNTDSSLGSGNGNGGVELETEGNATEDEIGSLNTDSSSGSRNDNGGVVMGGRAERITEKLERELSPIELEVDDVSYQHAGHVGNRTGEVGTHINLRIVTKEFEGKSVVKRHRMIYALLEDELASGLHALSIVAKAPGEAV